MTKKLAFIFPGQGSQSPGMGFELATRFEDFKLLYEKHLKLADEILDFSISTLMKEGPAEKLKHTEVTQPALLVCSVAMNRWLEAHDIRPSYCLGHSLGEYSALVAAGSLSFEDALRVVYQRGKFMNEAMPAGEGAMAALVGASDEEAVNLCKEASNDTYRVEASVFNCSGQVVISGHRQAIEEAEKKASHFGVRRFARLEVSGPFHSSLLKPAGDKLATTLEKIKIESPKVPVIANVSAQIQSQPEEIRSNLAEQVYKPVLWSESVRFVGREGIEDFVEVGSGKVLSGLIRKILPDARCTPTDGLQRLEILKEAPAP
ncbi:MAG: ACP S-malonyltransferase [Bdellovibrionota bacterium]